MDSPTVQVSYMQTITTAATECSKMLPQELAAMNMKAAVQSPSMAVAYLRVEVFKVFQPVPELAVVGIHRRIGELKA